MKRFIILFLMLAGLQITARADDKPSNKKPDLVIPVHNGHLQKDPRDAGAAPVLCEYQNGTLVLRYLKNIGELGIAVTNLNTGKSTVVEASSADGCTFIYIGEASGDYYLEIATSCGDWYFAYFSL